MITLGLLVDNYYVEKWILGLVENIIKLDTSIDIYILVTDVSYMRQKNRFLRLVEKVDLALNKIKVNQCEIINLKYYQQKNNEEIIELGKITKKLQLDLVIDLTYNCKFKPYDSIDCNNFIKIVDLFGEKFCENTCLYEIQSNSNITGFFIEHFNAETNTRTILKRYKTKLNKNSIILNKNKLSLRIIDLIADVIKEMCKYGSLNLHIESDMDVSTIKDNHYHSLIFYLQLCYNIILFVLREGTRKFLFRIQWRLAIRKRCPDLFNNKENKFIAINPRANTFYADPFIVNYGDKNHIFFEEYNYSSHKGNISVMNINSDGDTSEPCIILDKEYHLSYPFVFENEGNWYMIPETSANRTIELYKCEYFPYKWVLEKILFNEIDAVDSTIFLYSNKFWLFTNIKKSGSWYDDELFLFYSDSLDGNWVSHPKNPIVSSPRSARNAGKIFIHDEKIIRPSQDCSIRYGNAVNYNIIEVLTETDYKERKVNSFLWKDFLSAKGIHTYNFSDDYEIIDFSKFILKKRLLRK